MTWHSHGFCMTICENEPWQWQQGKVASIKEQNGNGKWPQLAEMLSHLLTQGHSDVPQFPMRRFDHSCLDGLSIRLWHRTPQNEGGQDSMKNCLFKMDCSCSNGHRAAGKMKRSVATCTSFALVGPIKMCGFCPIKTEGHIWNMCKLLVAGPLHIGKKILLL